MCVVVVVVVVVIYDFSTYVTVVLSMSQTKRGVCCCCFYLRLQYLRDSGLIHVPDKERCVLLLLLFTTSVLT